MSLLAFWKKICSWFPTCKYGVTALARLRLLQLEQICCTDFSENLPQARTEYKWKIFSGFGPIIQNSPWRRSTQFLQNVGTHAKLVARKKKRKKPNILLRLGKASQGVCFAIPPNGKNSRLAVHHCP